ncbi:hypothetical protein, partial [Actinophytocola sp.]|uniref:hypothetical protein n=1 Tax=Actinophytocola sp. TaxID=1872138 RepID=UPI002D8053E6
MIDELTGGWCRAGLDASPRWAVVRRDVWGRTVVGIRAQPDTAPLCEVMPAQLGGRIDAVDVVPHDDGNAAIGGIWRVGGPAGSAVLKIIKPPACRQADAAAWRASFAPDHWNYWRRELLAHLSGFAGAVYRDCGIAAPQLLEVGQRPDGGIELWLADVRGTPGVSWTVSHLAHFAWQLGTAQAQWVDRVPDLPWLSRRWLAQYLDHGPARGVRNGAAAPWQHPVATVWPAAVRSGLRRLWAERSTVLALAEATPRTVCHLDVSPTNLVDDGDVSVLLGWWYAGAGGVGQDAADLIVRCATDGVVDGALLPDLAAAVTDRYLAGLRDGGWTGAVDPVRRAIAIHGTARYCWFAPATLGRLICQGTFRHPR